MKKSSLLAAACGLALAGSASAQTTLALYNFQSTNLLPGALVSADANSDSVASSLGMGAGFGTTGTNTWGISTSTAQGATPNHLYVRSSVTAADLAGAISGNDYFEFTLTPNAGFEADYSTVSFNHAFTVLNGTDSGTVVVRSSLDSFAADLGSYTRTNATTTTVNTSIALSSLPAFQGVTSAVTFRFYVFDNVNINNTLHRIDDITLTGTVSAIPEPSGVAALAGLGMLGFAALRRRRRVAA